MQNIFEQYMIEPVPGQIEKNIQDIQKTSEQYVNVEYLKKIFSMIDLTSLNTQDNDTDIVNLCRKVNEFSGKFKDMPPVAAICVWPSLVSTVRRNLQAGGIKVASVAGGFPSSQTFREIKINETAMAVEAGADEIDIVMPVGRFLDGDYIGVAGEIKEMKLAAGPAHLKVILETGVFENETDIRNASLLAMHAGADFIKTSTGKVSPAASFHAVYVMALAVRDFYRRTGKKVGIKPAGGIVEPADAVIYALITERILGEEWVKPELFRIGASRLSNNILTAVNKLRSEAASDITWF